VSGRLVTLEGLDGSGKTTQMELLKADLRARGAAFRSVKFPSYGQPFAAPALMYLSGGFGDRPDDVNAYAASAFFAVDRCASYLKLWRKDYERGALILADRYTTSNMIYQLPKLPRGEWEGCLSWLQDFEYAKLGLPRPALTVFLDMPPEMSQRLLDVRYRRDGGGRDIHERDREYLRLCRESALFAAERLGWRVIPCAAGGELRGEEQIHAEVMKSLLAASDGGGRP